MNAAALHTAALLDSTHGKPKLLVVDDQPVHLQLLMHTLSSDYQVYMATSGEQALALCRSDPPDLVLLDVLMPGMDGFSVCKALKADPRTAGLPIIFVTARSDPGQETHGLSLGAVDFIAKPINPAVVKARVHTHLTLKFQSDMLKKLVLLDGLSGVFNRRYFDQQLASEWARSTRSNQPLSLILVDVDHFEAYNARYGHQAGDDCLRMIAVALKGVLRRPADLVARFAGEEFACLLPDTSPAHARKLANDMEQRVRELAGLKPEHAALRQVTVSLGLITRLQAAPVSWETFLHTASEQLQLAKRAGTGQIRATQLEGVANPTS
ncbi:diguanylate cyclase [Rhodoferax sp.]|uniref:diguanylate cyclase domain-containing protein n=1 Tax=Rhodoferax sp. TaxID=50421 RepID=UPI0025F522C2|nr:diguanylate cyclase [Rhodoferax sp.]